MVKLPGTDARDQEAKLWAERYFQNAPSEVSRVAAILAERLACRLNELEPHRLLDSYEGFSELNHVQLVLALESEFGLTISDAEGEVMTTPARVVSVMVKRLNPRHCI